MLWQRFLGVILIIWTFTGCGQLESEAYKKLVIGVVGYGESNLSFKQYSDLQNYLSMELKSIIEIEPAYNEIQALEQIEKQKWDLVFASSGLAAIAIYRHKYQPIIPLEGVEKNLSAIVVNKDSPFNNYKDLARQNIALGQEGSTAGYYLPIYNLYGLALEKVLFSPTPKTSLEWLEQGEVAAAALSLQEFNKYRKDFKPNQFRVLDVDSRPIPSGAIIIADKIEPKQLVAILNAFKQAPSHIAASAKFLPQEKAPEYEYLIKVIKRVTPISQRIKQEPALFYEPKETSLNK